MHINRLAVDVSNYEVQFRYEPIIVGYEATVVPKKSLSEKEARKIIVELVERFNLMEPHPFFDVKLEEKKNGMWKFIVEPI